MWSTTIGSRCEPSGWRCPGGSASVMHPPKKSVTNNRSSKLMGVRCKFEGWACRLPISHAPYNLRGLWGTPRVVKTTRRIASRLKTANTFGPSSDGVRTSAVNSLGHRARDPSQNPTNTQFRLVTYSVVPWRTWPRLRDRLRPNTLHYPATVEVTPSEHPQVHFFSFHPRKHCHDD